VRPAVFLAAALVAGAACRSDGPPSPAAPPAPAPASPAPVHDAVAGAEAPLSDGERAEIEGLVATACVGCHTIDMLAQQRLNRTQWENTVKKMKVWGAPIEPAQMLRTARYLADRFGPEAGPWEPPPVDPATALADLAPLPDGPFARGDAEAGKGLYARRCALCHGPDATGTPLGVNLVDRPALTRAPDFATLVRTGRGRMPALAMPDEDVAALLAHLRGLR
jgi:mono/diheme cytochrome c family protein